MLRKSGAKQHEMIHVCWHVARLALPRWRREQTGAQRGQHRGVSKGRYEVEAPAGHVEVSRGRSVR